MTTNNEKSSLHIFWHKIKPEAIIPTKRDEDAGYDIYTIEDNIVVDKFSKHLFSTGLQYFIKEKNYYLQAQDRGSTGSKGIHIHCGVCDNGYRGEIFICLSNDNDFPITFKRGKSGYDEQTKMFYYDINKAIAQLVPLEMPFVDAQEINDDEWNALLENDSSKRKDTKLGQSGK